MLDFVNVAQAYGSHQLPFTLEKIYIRGPFKSVGNRSNIRPIRREGVQIVFSRIMSEPCITNA